MSNVYMIVPLGDEHEHIRDSIRNLSEAVAKYDDYAPRAWFVSFDGTAKQLSEKIGLPGNNAEIAVVAGVDDYYGFGSKDLWQWLKNQTP